MGSPPWRKRSMVEPFTVMMSSLPSLSQSISPAPPLMDSTMYFFSGVEMWETVRPASLATSLNRGNGGLETAVCSGASRGRNRDKKRSSRMARIVVIIVQKLHRHAKAANTCLSPTLLNLFATGLFGRHVHSCDSDQWR